MATAKPHAIAGRSPGFLQHDGHRHQLIVPGAQGSSFEDRYISEFRPCTGKKPPAIRSEGCRHLPDIDHRDDRWGRRGGGVARRCDRRSVRVRRIRRHECFWLRRAPRCTSRGPHDQQDRCACRSDFEPSRCRQRAPRNPTLGSARAKRLPAFQILGATRRIAARAPGQEENAHAADHVEREAREVRAGVPEQRTEIARDAREDSPAGSKRA
jgi:hypothetical protein